MGFHCHLGVPCFFQLLSWCGVEVSGRWERQQSMDISSILWPGLKKAFMTFIHFYQTEVSYEIPPGCKLFWEMYSSWLCQRKIWLGHLCCCICHSLCYGLTTCTQVTELLFPHSHLQFLPFHLCFCFKEVRSCHSTRL